ncbi:hypothetical protein TWF694_009005 [Orbilia ellipsospora]|uniref:Rhodopsin domain-containing protein n=1 Tax=Orbilia ellipsospora TaxID=2528407 RepID=A0AAV9XF38_9PEZI
MSPTQVEYFSKNPDSPQTKKIMLGGKLSVPSRICLVGGLWALKFVVLDFLWRIIKKLPYERRIMATYVFALAGSWIAATVALFFECQPISKWWQIDPYPGKCVQANRWLIIYEVGNLLTDTMLLALPFPILCMARVPWERRTRLFFVFSLGFFLIAVSIVRVIQGLSHSHFQISRTLWAAVETLFATVVACTPSIYCILRRGREDSRKGSSTYNTYRNSASSSGGGRTSGRQSAANAYGSNNMWDTARLMSIVDRSDGRYRNHSGSERQSSVFSSYAGSETKRITSHSGRNASVVSRNMSVSSRSSKGGGRYRPPSYSGVHFDNYSEGEVTDGLSYPGRGSVSSNIWSYGSGGVEDGMNEGDIVEKDEKKRDGFDVINEEEGRDLETIEGIVVETTWSQVSEVDPNTSLKVTSMVEPHGRITNIPEDLEIGYH